MEGTPPKDAALLNELSIPAEEQSASVKSPSASSRSTKNTPSASRSGLKHIGGYFERSDVEKFVVLRARLALDNSQLIKLAIEELYQKHESKRPFGE
jgi:hypothetical protein